MEIKQYSIEPTTRKCVKDIGFFSFIKKYKKWLLDRGLVTKICNKKMGQSKWFIKWAMFCQQKYKV